MALTENQLTDVFKNNFGRTPNQTEVGKYSGADLGQLSNMTDPTYALVAGGEGKPSTVYNKTTNQGYANKEAFAKDVGVDPGSLDFSKFKFDTAYQPGQQPYTEQAVQDPTKTPFDASKSYQDAYSQLGGDAAKASFTNAQSQINNIDSQMESLKQQKLDEAHKSGGIVTESQIEQEVANENQHLMLQKSALTRQLQTAQSSYNGVIKQAQVQAQLAENTYKDKISAYSASQRSQFNLASLAQRTSYQDATLNQKDASLQEKAAKDGVSLGDTSSGVSVAASRYNDPGVSVDPVPAADGGSFLKFSSKEAGTAAIGILLKSGSYANLSVDKALRQWSNNAYGGTGISGVNSGAKMSGLSGTQLAQVVSTIIKNEGGIKSGSRQDRNNNPGNIKVPKGSATSGTSDVKTIAQAIIEGKQPPDLKGLYGKGAAVKAELERQGFNLTKATEDWTATQKFLATANSSTQLRLRQAISFTKESLPIVDDLNSKAEAALHRYGITEFAKVQKDAALQGVYGQEVKSAFTQLDSQIGDLVSELATVYKGGNSSTNDGLAQAAKMLSVNWDFKTLKENVELIKRNLAIRQSSVTSVGVAGVSSDNAYAPDSQPSSTSPSTPFNASDYRSKYNY